MASMIAASGAPMSGGTAPERAAIHDWARASFVTSSTRPASRPGAGLFAGLPFSFVYDGRSSAGLLNEWKCEVRPLEKTNADGRDGRIIAWTDPGTGLEVTCELTVFTEFPAAEWVLRFRNTGAVDTPMLENVLPLDLGIAAPAGDVVLHRAYGSTATATDFLPVDEVLKPDAVVNLAPSGGRSSDGVLPFFNLEWSGGGLAWAVGWSGQWSQRVERGAAEVQLKAGQQTLRVKLQPGESIRTPRILVVNWQGPDRLRGHNLLRRLLLAQYVPRRDGELTMPPVTQNAWFVFSDGNGTTEDNQLRYIRAMPGLGVEAYWLDAGWFEGGWPNGVGSWVPRADHFPRGLKPLGDEAHRLGLKFLVWFEPERVNPASRIAREHPEFVLGWKDGKTGNGLFNLGDPAARAWLTDLLSAAITEGGIDIYRTDFNMAPLPYWQKADGPDRQGITENRYVAGLYALWDDLRRRHPHLVFDDCASGGRRIDLETMSRSYALSRSDSVGVKAATPAWDQAQTAGLSLYVPLHATLTTLKPDLYAFRSAATAGLGLCQDSFAKDFPADAFRQAAEECKSLRPLYAGDFCPLTPINVDERRWMAWQFDRPDLGRGFAMFFRRPLSPDAAFDCALTGLDPAAAYEVTFVDGGKTERRTGADLTRLTVEIASAPGSLLVTYRRLDR